MKHYRALASASVVRSRGLVYAVVVAGVLNLGVGLANAKKVESAYASLFEEAVHLFDTGEYKTAIIQLKNVLQKNPSDLPARILIGRAYLKTGDPVSAEKELRRARAGGADEELLVIPLASAMLMQRRFDEVIDDISPEGRSAKVEAGLQVIRGQAFLGKRLLSRAAQSFQRADDLLPGKAITKIGMAQYFIARSELTSAVPLIDEAISAEPENFFAWSTKGQLLRRLGRGSEALRAFDKAVEIAPEDVPSRIGRAGLLLENKQAAEAESDINFILERQPRNAHAIYLNAVRFGIQGDRTKYQQLLQETDSILRGLEVERFKSDPTLYLLSGLVNNAVGNYADAYNSLKEFIRYEAFHAGARALMGRLMLRRGLNREALTMLQTAHELSPNDPALLRLLGISMMKNGRYAEAGESFSRSLQLSPDDGSVKTFLALSHLQAGNNEDAVEGLQKALSTDPSSVRPGLMLALVLLRERKFKEAKEVAQEVAKRMPGDATPYNILGAAKWGLGDAAGARKDLESAIGIDPNYFDAQINLAKIDLREGKVEAAKARYNSMLEQDEIAIDALLALANIAKRERQYDQAISYLSKAREKAPSNIPVQLDLIRTLQFVGDLPAARRAAMKLRDRFPDNLAVLEHLGRLELAGGKLKAAAAIFNRMRDVVRGNDPGLLKIAENLQISNDLVGAHKALLKAITSNPGNLRAQAAIVALETQMGRVETALSRADGLRKRYPDLTLGHALRGDIMMQSRRYDEAAVSYSAALRREKTGELLTRLYLARKEAQAGNLPVDEMAEWVKSNPNDVRSRHALAGAYIHTKRYGDAIQHYEYLYKASDKDVAAINNLAWLYQKTKDERALAFAEKAFGLSGQQPQTLDTYGWILVQKGELERGLRILRDAYARESRNTGIRYHLAFALSKLGRTEEAQRHLKEVIKSTNDSEIREDAMRLLKEIEA